MRCAILVGLALSFGTPAWAVDLAKIDRRIARLPEFKSAEPEYCLLVFGPTAAKRVWLVRDGDVLYVDRNGNGDLTDEGERVANDPPATVGEDVYWFKAGDIADGGASHKDLIVSWLRVDHLKDQDPELKARLARDPKFRGCTIALDVALAGWQGGGIGGRVRQVAGVNDTRGYLEFAGRPEDAPIIHFGGPWEVTLAGSERWHVGEHKEVYLAMGTPGLGPGTTAWVGYDGVIPDELKPTLHVVFPGETPIEETFELARRCCTYNLYGDVSVPESAVAGTAKVDVWLPEWEGATVAPTTHEVTILPARPGPKLAPLSARLVSKLRHSDPQAYPDSIAFSPDGRRLVAFDRGRGVAHMWDVASGERLVTIELGDDYYGPFEVSPDWKTLVTTRKSKGKFTRLQEEGKTLAHLEFEDAIRVWDLSTGALAHNWQDAPPRGYASLRLVPGGSLCVSQEFVAGKFEKRRPAAVSLWNLATGEHRQVLEGDALLGAISADGKLAAIALPRDDEPDHHGSLTIFSLPDFKPAGKIALPKLARSVAIAFLDGGQVAAAAVTRYDKPLDWQNGHSSLVCWRVSDGEELLSIPLDEKGVMLTGVQASPDGRTLAATTFCQQPTGRKLILVDWPSRTSKVIDFEPDAFVRVPVFHPSGKFLIVPIQVIPRSQMTRDVDARLLPQPKIYVIDAASGQVLETLMTTQSHQISSAFSPDGRWLATSGTGEVLLWDFHRPPEMPAQADK